MTSRIDNEVIESKRVNNRAKGSTKRLLKVVRRLILLLYSVKRSCNYNANL